MDKRMVTVNLLETIVHKAMDRDGLSVSDRHDIDNEFARTANDSERVKKVLQAFDDLYVNTNERGDLIRLLNLDVRGQSALDSLVGHDGMELARKRFANHPITAYTTIKNTQTHAKVRAAAALHLGRSNDPAALTVLTKALKAERDWSARFAIAKALIMLDSSTRKRADVIAALVQAYRMGDKAVRSYAMSRFKDVRHRNVMDVFIHASTHRNPPIRRSSIRVLAQLNYPKAKAAVLKAINDKDPGVRAAVPQPIKNEVLRVTGLIKLMKSRHANRDYIVKQLSSVKDPVARLVVTEMIKLLTNRDPRIRFAAAKALAKLNDSRVIDALASLVSDWRVEIRTFVVEYMSASKDPKVIDVLVTAMRDNDGGIRYRAITCLKDVCDVRLVPVFSRALRDRLAIIRKAAVQGLGKMKDPRAVPALIAALKNRDKYVRWAAVKELGAIKDPRVVPALIAVVLKDRDRYVRNAAVEVLGKIKDPKAVPALIAVVLKDRDKYVRWAADAALGKIKDPRAVPALIAALKGRVCCKGVLCWVIARALSKIKDPRVVPALIAVVLRARKWEVRRAAAWALGAIKDNRAVPALIVAALKGRVWVVREEAAKALGKIKDPRAVPALIAVVFKDLRWWWVRNAAVEALGKIKDPKAVPALIAVALKDTVTYIRIRAVEALGKIKDPKAVSALIAVVLKDPHVGVRGSAAYALKTFGVVIPRTSP